MNWPHILRTWGGLGGWGEAERVGPGRRDGRGRCGRQAEPRRWDGRSRYGGGRRSRGTGHRARRRLRGQGGSCKITPRNWPKASKFRGSRASHRTASPQNPRSRFLPNDERGALTPNQRHLPRNFDAFGQFARQLPRSFLGMRRGMAWEEAGASTECETGGACGGRVTDAQKRQADLDGEQCSPLAVSYPIWRVIRDRVGPFEREWRQKARSRFERTTKALRFREIGGPLARITCQILI